MSGRRRASSDMPASQLAPCRLRRSRLLPVGSAKESESDFQLIAGTNRDLGEAVAQGRFCDGLYARLNLWTFALPGLANRREDIAPNLNYEFDRHCQTNQILVRFDILKLRVSQPSDPLPRT